MKDDGTGPRRVGDLVGRFLEEKGVREQLGRLEVLEEWEERVGEHVARVTRPREIREATLFVEVRSSPWLMELNMMKGRILERLNEGRERGRIEKLVFVLAERP